MLKAWGMHSGKDDGGDTVSSRIKAGQEEENSVNLHR